MFLQNKDFSAVSLVRLLQLDLLGCSFLHLIIFPLIKFQIFAIKPLFIFWPKSFSSTGIPRLVRFFGPLATALFEKPH